MMGSHQYIQVVLFLSVISTSAALPSGYTRELPPPKVGWQESPQNRGTFDLLLACLTTLSLCAWTAYHPNVPTGRSEWRRAGHRLVWMTVAVFVPEAVLWCAWEQWWVARQMKNSINKMVHEDSESAKERKAQSEAECYVCNGRDVYGTKLNQEEETGTSAEDVESLAMSEEGHGSSPPVTASDPPSRSNSIHEPHPSSRSNSIHEPHPPSCSNSIHEPPSEQEEFQPKPPMETWTLSQSFFALSGGYALPSPHANCLPLTLTPAGILFLFRLNILPPTSPSAISDKSKAGGIAKVLVCLQAGWFIVQVIARAAARLPITTLEIHVLAHVLCAFAIYACWFEKGYDVGEPIVIESEEGRNLGALFALESKESERRVISRCACSSPPIDPSMITPTLYNPTCHSSSIYWRKLLGEFEIRPKSSESTKNSLETLDRKSPEYLLQIERANRALRLLKSHSIHMRYVEDIVGVGEDMRRYIHAGRKFTVPIRSDLTVEGLDTDITDSRKGFSKRQIRRYGVISIAYGALHFLALSPTHFPTIIEYYLWLSSSISMIAAPFFTMLILYDPLPQISGRIEDSPSNTKMARGLKWAANFLLSLPTLTLYMLMLISVGCYLFARPYVLVESLAGLRAAEARIYETVEWTSFIPHAG